MALKELDALAQAVPGLNQKAAKQQQAAQRIQARAAVGQADPRQTPAQISQQVGAPLMQAQQQVGQQAQQQTQQTQLGIAGQQAQAQAFQGQQQLAKEGMQQQAQLGQRVRDLKLGETRADIKQQRQATDKELKQAERLQKLGMEQDNKILQMDLNLRKQLQSLGHDLEDKLFDSRRRFNQDEMGRKFSNERQLADAAILTAKDEADAQRRLQQIQQAAKMKAMILEAAHNRVMQEMDHTTRRGVSDIEKETHRHLAEEARKAKKAQARAKAKATATGNMIQGVFTVAGTAVGAYFGNPAMGAAAGAGVGQAVSGLFS